MEIFTAIGQGKKHRYVFVVLATTESEARMWVEKWLGSFGQILWIGQGEPDFPSVDAAHGHQDIDSTWVFAQDKTGKFFQLV